MSELPQIAREAWNLHPNFPHQTLLLRSHENFRRLALRVEELLEESAEFSLRVFRRWMYAMASHERYEEGKLYPFLERRWRADMGALVEGHELLAERKRAVFEAFADHADGEAELPDLRRALRRFREALEEHLELEENTVIPLLLELSPSEFADYYLLPIETLLARLPADV